MADSSEAPKGADFLKAQTLQTLTPSLHSSLSNISSSSRIIPSDRDFHFFYNFDEFKDPIREIAHGSQLLLQSLGSSPAPWGSTAVGAPPEELDDGGAYDWLVNVNDEALERLDASIDEFKRLRKVEEESGKRIMDPGGDGFQLVVGKKKNKGAPGRNPAGGLVSEPSNVKVAALRDKKVSGTVKPKIPFHIPTIKRPQDEYNILVNNSNQPFQHVWLQKSDDGERFIHPLEKLSVLDFVDKDVGNIKPEKPLALGDTPFKIVTDVKDLKALAAKLRAVDEFAVDLEHNQYRSFQGLTCLMQISTRSEDFVVDALKLRIHIGPYLREVFKDPSKRKVMHGADRDIVWLQRDFGIYVCNMFDTGQASRVLKLERYSLEFILHHFCGVTANKEYQNADWRLRPLPEEMVRYAREDTHYLLYIYDLMRLELYKFSENSDTALVEVYKRSADICMQLYEKELLTESSYLHLYGLKEADFSAQQLAVVAGLYEWRDVVARAEDESTGYILPNKTLLEIGKQVTVNTGQLHRIIKSKHHYIERNLGSVVNIVRHSIQNASAFETTVEQLKQARAEANALVANRLANEGSEPAQDDASPKLDVANADTEVTPPSPSVKGDDIEIEATNAATEISDNLAIDEETKNLPDNTVSVCPAETLPDAVESSNPDSNTRIPNPATNAGASVPVLKKPNRAFGALFGSSGPKRKINTEKKEEEEKKLVLIRHSVALPFHSFSWKTNELVPEDRREEPPITSETHHDPEETVPETSAVQPPASNNAADVILIEDDDSDEELIEITSQTAKATEDMDSEEEEPMSLAELSSSFDKCLDSINGKNNSKVDKGCPNAVQVKPFDYEAARREVRFGEVDRKGKAGREKDGSLKIVKGSDGKKNGSEVEGQVKGIDEGNEFRQGRRRLAFPATGNRSATFRSD